MSSQQLTVRRVGGPPLHSPLRYPGGKRKLANFIASLVSANRLHDGHYAEAFAGGSSVALALLFGEYVRHVHINDRDRGVHAFWLAVRDRTAEFCERIRKARLTLREWDRQREIQMSAEPDPLDLAFSTFYLNRTNRSGIITGGVIGGRDQRGTWKVDARFNRDDLMRRIERIGRWKSRINISGLDGKDFLRQIDEALPSKSLVYLDPPYFVKGQQKLYANFYGPNDHADLASHVKHLRLPWLVTYDDAPEIRTLYKSYRSIAYTISYNAQLSYRGNEVMFLSRRLLVPATDDPTRVTARDVHRLAAAAVPRG